MKKVTKKLSVESKFSSDEIKCPRCSHSFELTSVMRARIEADLKKEHEAALQLALTEHDAEHATALATMRKENASLRTRFQKLEESVRTSEAESERRVADAVSRTRRETETKLREQAEREKLAALIAKDAEIADAQGKLAAATKDAAAFAQKSRQLEDRCHRIELENEKKLAAESVKLREELEAQMRERVARSTADATRLKDVELADAQERLSRAREAETVLVKRNCELEDAQRQAQNDLEARVRQAGDRIRAEVEAEAAMQRSLLEAERDLRIKDANAKIAELQQKLCQGSQQLQGEAQEVVLLDLVTRAFARDEVKEIAVGVHGADLTQSVRDENDREVATILWESKRTKHWSNDWLPKLRDDMRAHGSACAILVTNALPQGMTTFGEVDGVWVCSPTFAEGVARILRAGLLELATARRAESGRTDKMHLLYRYLTGPEFKSRLSGAFEAFREMQTALDREQKTIRSSWHQRQRQIARAIENLTAFYGDVRGIAGREVATVAELEFDAPALTAARDDGDEIAPELVELFYALVPADRPIGNITLRELLREAAADRLALDVDDADYARCRETLIESGRIVLGRGRGGSVSRAPVAEAAAE